MNLTPEETKELKKLYKIANEINSNNQWNDLNKFFEVIGKSYGFDPKKYYISTEGEIIKTKKCYRCGGIANSIRGIKYDRFKESFGWTNRPICWSCYMRKYPHKAKKEIMK